MYCVGLITDTASGSPVSMPLRRVRMRSIRVVVIFSPVVFCSSITILGQSIGVQWTGPPLALISSRETNCNGMCRCRT